MTASPSTTDQVNTWKFNVTRAGTDGWEIDSSELTITVVNGCTTAVLALSRTIFPAPPTPFISYTLNAEAATFVWTEDPFSFTTTGKDCGAKIATLTLNGNIITTDLS